MILPIVRAFAARAHTTPSADFCHAVRPPYDVLSHDSLTHSRSPVISSTAFHARPPDLPPVPLMEIWASQLLACSPGPVGLIIRFLFFGPRVCSTLPSDPTSRPRPCASLDLHLHQVGQRPFTSKLSNMHGVQTKRGHAPPSSIPIAAGPVSRILSAALSRRGVPGVPLLSPSFGDRVGRELRRQRAAGRSFL